MLRARDDNVALNVVVATRGESRVVSMAALEVSLMSCCEVMTEWMTTLGAATSLAVSLAELEISEVSAWTTCLLWTKQGKWS